MLLFIRTRMKIPGRLGSGSAQFQSYQGTEHQYGFQNARQQLVLRVSVCLSWPKPTFKLQEKQQQPAEHEGDSNASSRAICAATSTYGTWYQVPTIHDTINRHLVHGMASSSNRKLSK